MEGAGQAEQDERAEALGYRFRDARWLEQALTHRSAVAEESLQGVAHNERLEFLGDAVVGLVVSWWLFRGYAADKPEGELTALRAQLVRRSTLAELARRWGLTGRIRLGKGAEMQGARRQERLLASAFEAVVGAIFVDVGWEAARQAVERCLPDLTTAIRPAAEANPKGALQEWLARHGRAAPQYRLVEACGPPHARRFKVEVHCPPDLVVTAEGSSRRRAEEAGPPAP
ncbi:MAG: ribonuclease III, partial [Firmicutes bacterium]|nr:ribonuclease III [Bacillota bacterium]